MNQRKMREAFEKWNASRVTLTGGEYDRLWPIIHGRLTPEEEAFWARTCSLQCEFANRQEQRWKRLAVAAIVVNVALVAWLCAAMV